MALHPGEQGYCTKHGVYDEYCGPCGAEKIVKRRAAKTTLTEQYRATEDHVHTRPYQEANCTKCVPLCQHCKHDAHRPGRCTERITDAAGDTDTCACLYGTQIVRLRRTEDYDGNVAGETIPVVESKLDTTQQATEWVNHNDYLHVKGWRGCTICFPPPPPPAKWGLALRNWPDGYFLELKRGSEAVQLLTTKDFDAAKAATKAMMEWKLGK